MAEQQGGFRTTISLPGDLKSRMDKAGEPVNWSAIACRAFEDKLAEIAARKEHKVMRDVVERLRASLREEQGESFNEGYETGKRWAENTASALQLKRLESFLKTTKEKPRPAWETWFRNDGNHKPWLELVRVIQGNRSLPVVPFVNEFWNGLVGEKSRQPNDGDFLRGFVEGAVDIWTQVQEQL